MYIDEHLFSDFLQEQEILWMGIDFSKAKFTQKGFEISIEQLQKLFTDWNTLIISDTKKYDIRLAFRKPIMHYDLFSVSRRNKSIKLSQILTPFINLKSQLSEEEIISYITTFDFLQIAPFALLVLVESFDSLSRTASLWMVIVKTSDKSVVLCDKLLKIPSGLKTKTYWGRVFYNLFFDILKYHYTQWVNLIQPSNNH
jgi:hypothetical protein